MKLSRLTLVTAAMAVAPGWAQDANGRASDEQAIRAVISGYNEARNAFDTEKIVTFFTEDADFIGNSGKPLRGRSNIAQIFTKGSESLKGTRVKRNVAGTRFIKPDVAVVTVLGSMTGGRTMRLMDVDVMVKQGGSWLIASQHNLVVPEPGGAARGVDDPFLGNWRLNVEKSEVSSGQVPAGRTMKIESDGNGLVLTLEGGGIAPPQKQRLTFNGEEQPTTSTPLAKRTGATVVTYTKASSREIEAAYKKDGKVVATQKRRVSDDGKSLTSTMDGVGLDGKKFHEVFTSDKQ